MRGHLATLSDINEYNFVKTLFAHANPWVALADTATEGNWTWMAGPEVGLAGFVPKEVWGPTEPNGGRGENCMVLNTNNYIDVNCNSHYRFIIEYECQDNTATCNDCKNNEVLRFFAF